LERLVTSGRAIGSQEAVRSSRLQEQRGIVLITALIVMLAMVLAGLALMRSTDTAMIYSGNLAFRQASISAVDRSVEQSVHALFDAALVADKTNNYLAQNYYACVQAASGGCIAANSSIPEIPKVLQDSQASPFSASAFAAAGLSDTLVPADAGGNKSYYLIERMCLSAGPAIASNCNLSGSAFGADPGTQHYEGLVRAGDAYYRVTVRVEGPRNTVSYAQALLK
jgi:type IV pilus assembly protein PilX